MIQVSAIDLPSLTKDYLFANTPSYLYRHFRSNQSLQKLAKITTVLELEVEFTERINKEPRTLEDVVICYAILVTASLMSYQEAVQAFEEMDLTRIEWGSEIQAIYMSSAIVTNVFREEPHVPIKPFLETAKSTSSQNIATTSLKPTVTIRN